MTKRGGKRAARKRVYPSSGGASYVIDVVETYIQIDGRKHSTSYSVPHHGSVRANMFANVWLLRMRRDAFLADQRRAVAS